MHRLFRREISDNADLTPSCRDACPAAQMPGLARVKSSGSPTRARTGTDAESEAVWPRGVDHMRGLPLSPLFGHHGSQLSTCGSAPYVGSPVPPTLPARRSATHICSYSGQLMAKRGVPDILLDKHCREPGCRKSGPGARLVYERLLESVFFPDALGAGFQKSSEELILLHGSDPKIHPRANKELPDTLLYYGAPEAVHTEGGYLHETVALWRLGRAARTSSCLSTGERSSPSRMLPAASITCRRPPSKTR